MKITFLGTGTSRGVPVIGCRCRVCRSSNPKNKRLRSSILVEGDVNVVVDTSVDFRSQMLKYNVSRLDAVVFTHAHVDHILGLDDVYPFNIWSKKPLPVYASRATAAELKLTFRHLFVEERYPGIPSIEVIPIEGPFEIGGLQFLPVQVWHGKLPVLGFRIGRFAYVTDASKIPNGVIEQLRGVDSLVLNGLRYKSHPTHLNLDEAVAAAKLIGARKTWLIHMCHEVDHDEGNAYLPPSVSLTYDGLVLEIPEAEPSDTPTGSGHN